jgi:hypothetical protein
MPRNVLKRHPIPLPPEAYLARTNPAFEASSKSKSLPIKRNHQGETPDMGKSGVLVIPPHIRRIISIVGGKNRIKKQERGYFAFSENS